MHLEIPERTSLRRLRKIARALARRWKCPVNFTHEGRIIREDGPRISPPVSDARCKSNHGSYRRHLWSVKSQLCTRCGKQRNPAARPLGQEDAA